MDGVVWVGAECGAAARSGLTARQRDDGEAAVAFRLQRGAGVERQAGLAQPGRHLLVGKSQPLMLVLGLEDGEVVRREVDDEERRAGRHQPGRLGDHAARPVDMAQHLVDDDGIEPGRRHLILTQRVDRTGVGPAHANVAHRGLVDPRAGHAQHVRAGVQAEAVRETVGEEFEHSARAGADVEQGLVGSGQGRTNRRLDAGERRVLAAKRVPMLGLCREVGLALRLAPRAKGLKRRLVATAPEVVGIELRQGRLGERVRVQAEIGIGPFRGARGELRLAEKAQMARQARLALTEDVDEIADRELALAQQRGDAQPRRVGQGLEDGHELVEGCAHKDVFMCWRRNL